MIREKCVCGAELRVEHGLVDLERDTAAVWRTEHRHGDAPREGQADALVEMAQPHQPHAPLGFGLPPRPTTHEPE